jgi:multicomponent K+:H+ antiporter subunit E
MKWLPFPWLSALLWAVWLLLANELSTGSVLLGAVLAWVLPQATRFFWPSVPDLKRVGTMFRFVLVVHWDILVANVVVAWLILGPARRLEPAFVEVPVDLDSDFAITVLASTISLTPGTVTADVSADRKTLLVHALDVKDQQALIKQIKERYEKPLKEMFQC